MEFSKLSKRYLASYACTPEETQGRLYDEPKSPGRSCYQRDRDRIIHSTAFRRLEYKTQVFVFHEGDHYRNRLTHSMEVAQLSRDICRELDLEEDLSEAIALAHDLGHTPFGHAGEDALHLAMKEFGGFDHNAQTIRILTHLEQKYANFNGLNLTWECLEGLAKHNGAVKNAPRALAEYNEQHDLQLHTNPSLEAQIAALADDIAYNNHDIEDGLRAELFTLQDLVDLPLIGDVLITLQKEYPDLEAARLHYELRRNVTHKMVKDLVLTTQDNLTKHAIKSVDDVRNHSEFLVAFSTPIADALPEIKDFLMQKMYRHYKVNRMTHKARQVVSSLFAEFIKTPNLLPTHWYQNVQGKNQIEKATLIADFIAGMTDRFALEEHRKLCGANTRVFGE